MKNATDNLIEAIEKHGLPTEVGARGRIGEYIKYTISGEEEPIIESSESSKGWVVIPKDGEDEANFSDIESLQSVVQAFINGQTSGEYLICIDRTGAEKMLELSADEPDTESHDFESLIDEDKLKSIISQTTGDIPDSDEELNLMSFCFNYCQEAEWEKYFTLSYGVAWLTFSDGLQLGFTAKDSCIVSIDQ